MCEFNMNGQSTSFILNTNNKPEPLEIIPISKIINRNNTNTEHQIMHKQLSLHKEFKSFKENSIHLIHAQ